MSNLTILFTLALFLLCNSLFRTTHGHNNGLSFPLIHRDSLESSSSYRQTNLTVEEQTEKLIHLSVSRVQYLEHLIHGNSLKSTNPMIRPPLQLKPRPGVFLVQVGIGTFSSTPDYKTYYLEFDTGSGTIWTQCEGCNPCFHQRDPVFPRSQSRTYRAFPCNQCPPGTTCQHGHCMIDQAYEDGSRVQGIAATETFTFTSNVHGSLVSIHNLSFACVIHTQTYTTALDPNNIASGILGMNRQRSGFVSQVGENFGGLFSYCLTPIDYRSQRERMFLRFGDDIPHLPVRHRSHTPLLQERNPLYYLDLQAISVGWDRLNINPDVFRIRSDGSGGCIIDSGTALTQLINVAYTELVRVLKRKIEAKNPGIRMTSDAPRLCYDQPRPRAETRFPKLTFHFANNANFVVQPRAYMFGFTNPEPQTYCLMIGSSDKFTLFGSFQQVNHRIVYDTVNSQLHFSPQNCLFDN